MYKKHVTRINGAESKPVVIFTDKLDETRDTEARKVTDIKGKTKIDVKRSIVLSLNCTGGEQSTSYELPGKILRLKIKRKQTENSLVILLVLL